LWDPNPELMLGLALLDMFPGGKIDTTLSPNNFLRITIKWSLCAIMSSFWPHHNNNPIM
jgi:hypothetical protein